MAHIDLGNVGDLAKPPNTLIEKIANMFGVIYEPIRKVRDAKAEAKAMLILAEAGREVSEIATAAEIRRERQLRSLERFVIEQEREQINMESILADAVPAIESQAPTEKVEDDWLANFFDKCRLISDKEMQSVWSRILSGEANSPGKFSKRTVNFVALLDKDDAQYFAALCNYCVFLLEHVRPLVFDPNHEIYQLSGLNNSVFTHLESIGLISYGLATQYFQKLPQVVPILYGNKEIVVEYAEPGDHTLTVGHAMLTQMGMQLFTICKRKEVPGFADYVATQVKPAFGTATVKECSES